MSIEDIEYLYKNSVKENIIIKIDSKKRDKNIYPKPNKYKLNFEKPFKYVYGIDILDVSLPRTQYQIDKHNNELYFMNKATGGNEIKTIELDPNDYDISNLIIHINSKIAEVDNILKYKELTTPENKTNIVFFTNETPDTEFFILAYKSTCAEILGFDKLTNQLPNDNEIQTYNIITSQEVKEIYCRTEIIPYDDDTKWQSLISIAKELYWNSLTYNEREITDDKTDYLSNWYNNLSDDEKIRIVIPNDYTKILYGTYKSKKFPGNDAYINTMNYENEQVIIPNILNLTGDRFIKLRSNTIEKHLPNFYSGSNSIGLGLFKLSISGYTDERFDFNNIEYKDLHPIGKLSSIDFRFEMLDGELYDFKGVNHHFLLNIKYYTPVKNKGINNSINKKDYTLNTNYNPDLLEYKKTQYEKDDNSEDEIIELSNNFKKNFLEKEKQYLYSSDEDLDFINPYIETSNSETSIETSSDEDKHITPFHQNY